jgi:hypothetical protein
MIDLKELASEHDDLKTRADDGDSTLDDDDRARLAELDKLSRDLRDDLSDADRKGYHFIEEDSFESYARELAEDCEGRKAFDNWPMTCIDWAEAADQLRPDYSEIEFEGVTYLYRDP